MSLKTDSKGEIPFGYTYMSLKTDSKGETMTSKQRAYLRGLANTLEPVIHVGKASVTPEVTASVEEALEARELIKISVLKNCMDNPKEIAYILAERTHSEVVQVVGKKIILYKESKKKKK